ncbi:MAG: transcription-repair coupling factor [Prevotellaceae bacterium]|jgi:transcription-repair coupling factor (superfamily II helicase)|nr:transcription-repair coupling factor [Prevotellaceae bacterium]
MDASTLVSRFAAQAACRQLYSQICTNDGSAVSIRGLYGSARSLAVSAIFDRLRQTQIYVAVNRETAEYVAHDLVLWSNPEEVFFFPSAFRRSIEYGQSDISSIVQRTAALKALCAEKPCLVVTYPEAMAELMESREEMKNNLISIRTGERLSMTFFTELLAEIDFERVDFVTEPGQFAVRGSIIDVFSFADNQPYRIDFFGEEVESIRYFDLNTQRSDTTVTKLEIVPGQQRKKPTTASTLFDFAGPSAVIWIEDHRYVTGVVGQLGVKETLREAVLSPEMWEAVMTGQQSVVLLENARTNEGLAPSAGIAQADSLPRPLLMVRFDTALQPAFNKNFELLAADIAERAAQQYSVCIFSANPQQIERLKAVLASTGKAGMPVEFIPLAPHEGFIDHALQLVCYTDHQLFERYHRVTMQRTVEKSERFTWQELSTLQKGDYVVHIDHGIGIFDGLVKTTVNGTTQEVIKLLYRDNDVLFVNIHGLHRISKYRGQDSVPPKINKLGTGAWQNFKQRAKKKVKDIARELITLYAQRKRIAGFAFSGDTYLQHELEASFIYEDTPDQLKATQAVKADMEQPFPMDRLVCGDVGFGKTEIAIRAAVKAAADSKQVAVLVPTTILALQHFKTFSARLAGFPVTVDYISRLRPRPQIGQILHDTAEGKIDILIGTHKLLNREVAFKDLGLLVIDEEQKFGVAAKEKLRQLKMHVDTLTMTATPIPRTLQFSLMGARDLSIINTPPPNRHPIVTEVHPFHEGIIGDAINYEIQRGGQVFYLHNRIQDIEEMADIIRRICPSITLRIGHGRMPPEELEKVVLDFMNGDFDLLLCTTIIENGLDIPNANTIIINSAHLFGLSDLHQLRGRVGRSNRKAFCYLLAPPPILLNDEARKRLKAIETFSDLGSGFNIAMQDLNIRGAGNLLGGEQSGFIADMGFETYQKILNEALAELHDEQAAAGADLPAAHCPLPADTWGKVDCYIDTDMEILIPDSYVSNITEKLWLYKEMDTITDEAGLQKIIAELLDRFGALPPEVEQLCNIVRLRRMAMQLGFEKIVLKNRLMIVYFISNQLSNYYRSSVFTRILHYIQAHPKIFTVKEQNEKLMMTVRNVATVQQAMEIVQAIMK